MFSGESTYTNPNASGVQKICPKCFKVNAGDVAVCGGCGADLSGVRAEGAGIKKAGLFGFMPVDMPKMSALKDGTPKKVVAERVQKSADPASLPLSFPQNQPPEKPWA